MQEGSKYKQTNNKIIFLFNYTVAEYQVSICHTERDREMQIVAPTTGMPGEDIT
jgi:hypothetical protein